MDKETNHTPQLKRILKIAEIEADREQAAAVGVEHVLSAMRMEGSNPGSAMMEAAGLSLDDVRALNFEKK